MAALLLDVWELRSRSGCLLELGIWYASINGSLYCWTTVAKRPPSWSGGQLASIINGSLYWTTGNNCGREAAAFFYSSNCSKIWIFLGQLGTTSAAKRHPFYWTIETTTTAKRPPSWIVQLSSIINGSSIGRDNWKQLRSGRLFIGQLGTTAAKRLPSWIGKRLFCIRATAKIA